MDERSLVKLIRSVCGESSAVDVRQGVIRSYNDQYVSVVIKGSNKSIFAAYNDSVIPRAGDTCYIMRTKDADEWFLLSSFPRKRRSVRNAARQSPPLREMYPIPIDSNTFFTTKGVIESTPISGMTIGNTLSVSGSFIFRCNSAASEIRVFVTAFETEVAVAAFDLNDLGNTGDVTLTFSNVLFPVTETNTVLSFYAEAANAASTGVFVRNGYGYYTYMEV